MVSSNDTFYYGAGYRRGGEIGFGLVCIIDRAFEWFLSSSFFFLLRLFARVVFTLVFVQSSKSSCRMTLGLCYTAVWSKQPSPAKFCTNQIAMT